MKKNILHRIASAVLALSVLVGCMPLGAMAEADQIQSEKKIADAPTLNSYKEYFTEDTTAYAGLVWTDKSVFTDENKLAAALALGNNKLPTVQNCTNPGHGSHKTISLTENENFLVALSTSASNKSIDGYRERPTDTIFVLDVTGSMDTLLRGSDGEIEADSERILKLVPAVNNAISMLMNNNKNNRVGVVVYAGTEISVKELLPLGRYYYQETNGKKEYKNYIDVKIDTATENTDNDKNATGDYIWINPNIYREGDNEQMNPDGEAGTKRKSQVHSSTYIQGGLQLAKHEFCEVTDVKAEIKINNELQNTVRRIPALVLVTDGNPTKATANYASRGEAVNDLGVAEESEIEGSGSDNDSTVGMGFLCQLTALWVKEEMGKHYNEIDNISQLANVSDPVIPLFYTLGIQIQNRDAASITLDPANHKELVSDLWKEFNDSASSSMNVEVSSAGNISVSKDPNIQNYRYSPDGVYVDEAFEILTNDSAEYEAALEAIVEAIKLQSGYTPTMLQTSDGFNDGYVTFSDDVGEHMEFKDVKGLVLEDRLFTGEHAAEMFTAALGNHSDTTGNGYQIINAIATRLGLSTENGSAERKLAIDLIDAAYQAELLGPKNHVASEVGVGNSFGWFADEDMNILRGYGADNKPLAFWNWKDDPKGNADGAAYRVHSYIFYDEIKSNDAYNRSITNLNTIFMSVQVREHIESGKVSLVWRIPARLIPMNEFVVSLNETNDDVRRIQLEEEPPVRLIYEVGPKDGYKSYQIEETMRSLEAKSYQEVDVDNLETDIKHIVKAEDGVSYYLYSNAVDKTLEGNYQNIDRNVSQEDNTVSYFKPSNQNERYRFSVETTLYTASEGPDGKTAYTEYKGNELRSDMAYWYKQYVFAHQSVVKNKDSFVDLDKDGWGIVTVWHQLDANLVKENDHQGHKHIVRRNDGTWAVQPNTAEYPVDPIQKEKEEDKASGSKANPTDTLTYSDYAVLEMVDTENNEGYPHDGIDEGDYIISSVLGNNGRLIVTPDTGIAIRKKLVTGDMSDDLFTFVVSAVNGEGEKLSGKVDVTIDKPEPEKDEEKQITFTDGQASLSGIKADWTAHLALPAGTFVTVTEVLDDATGYKLESVTVENGVSSTLNEATEIEVKPGSQAIVVFTNDIPDENKYGLLALEKIATHNYKYGFDIPEDAEFVFELSFEKVENGKNIYADDVLYDTDGKAYQLDDGEVSVTLNPDQEIVFTGLEVGTMVTVAEIVGPEAGYKIEEIIVEAEEFEINEDDTVELEILDHQTAYRITVNNMYLDPSLPDTGDSSSLIFWTALLAMCSVTAIVCSGRRREM